MGLGGSARRDASESPAIFAALHVSGGPPDVARQERAMMAARGAQKRKLFRSAARTCASAISANVLDALADRR